MGLHDQIGISVLVSNPTITVTRGTPNTVAWVFDQGRTRTLTNELTGYEHSLNIVGGYDAATIGLLDDALALEWWVDYGLGMSVKVRSQAGVTVWEGFVNTVGLSMGVLTLDMGPVLDIGNRVSVVYSPINTARKGSVQNVREQTIWGENADSQERYGIRHAIFNLGNASATNATTVAGFQLAEAAHPKTTQRLAVGGSKPTVTLGCLGWWHMLDYPYRNTGTGTTLIETKIAAILAADPNGLFPGPHVLESSVVNTPVTEEQARTAQDIIRGLVSLGASTYVRTSFQIEEGRRARYYRIGNTPDYQQSLTDKSQNVYRYGGGRVFPWEVQAGKWIIIPDLLPGHTLPADLRQNVRAMLIEGVSYRAPYDLQLQGGPSDRLPQLLARAGLAGRGR